MDIIFFAFANNNYKRLTQLGLEEDNISAALNKRALLSHFFIEKHSISDKKYVAQALSRHWKDLSLFHFSGHANPEELEFVDGTAKLQGLTQLLTLQHQLKIVFLNGCSTYGHIEAYLAAGVPVVIATDAPVEDKVAADFSSFFYEAFSMEGVSIQEAFNMARAKTTLLYNKDFLDIYRCERVDAGEEIRGIGGVNIPNKSKEEGFNWGLYYLDEKDLNWTLPYQQLTASTNIVRVDLTEELIGVFGEYCGEIQKLIEEEREGKFVNDGEYRAAIIKCLPAPLGVQVRKLFTQLPLEVPLLKKEHIERLVTVYNVLMEMMTFTIINQLWEAGKSHKLVIQNEYRNAIRRFLTLKEFDRKTFNFVELIRIIRQIFDDNQIEYFVDELEGLKDILLNDQDFRASHKFLETTKWLLAANKMNPYSLPNNYLLAESHLATCLARMGFYAKYRMTAIKNINLVQPRHHITPVYSHSLVQLIACGTYDADSLPYKEYTYSRSVIMLKSLSNVSEFLPLTPFVIDKNAHDDKSPKSNIFFFSHFDTRVKAFIFWRADKPEEQLVVKRTRFRNLREERKLSLIQRYHNEIIEQFDAFAELFFDQTFEQL